MTRTRTHLETHGQIEIDREDGTSTQTIDGQDRNYIRKFLIPNVIILRENTEKVFKTEPWLEDMPIELLHIDGSHSVNGILIDWQFAEFVVDTGIIVIHDIKAHPGPIELVKAIDRDIYTVHELFLDDPKDFGMAVVYKKENKYDRVCS